MPAGSPDGGSRRRSRPLVALAVSLGLLALVEVGLRVAGFRHPPARLPVIAWDVPRDLEMLSGESLHRRDARTLWAAREGAEITWAPGERVSADGFRERGPGPAALRVLTLGDSSTFGMGVGERETYSAFLEEGLRADPEVARALAGESLQVLNGGTIGFTVRQGLERYRAVRGGWRPHVVVAAFGAVNEHFPMIVEPDRDKIAKERSRDDWWQRLYFWAGRRSRLFQVGIWWSDERRGGRRARLVEHARALEDSMLPFEVYLDVPGYERRVSTEDFRIAHDELLAEVRADGGRLVVMQMPRRPDQEEERWPILEYDPVLAAFARERGVPHVDARAVFAERFAEGATREELFVDGFHPTAAGQRLLADELLSDVRAAALAALAE